MKPVIKTFIFVIVAPNLFMACGPVLYSNVGHNVPLFQEKGEFSGHASISGSDGAWSANGIGLQGAYSVSDKVALISSFYSLKEDKFEANDHEWEGNGTYFELGGGFFGGNPKKNFLYEIFAGMGSAGIKNQSRIREEYINVKYLKPFIQPSLAFSILYFELALTPRIAYLNYTAKDDFLFIQDGDQMNPIEYFNKNNNLILFEPGITIRAGFPAVKLEVLYNRSSLKEPLINYTLVNRNYFSFGLRFLISDRISKNKNRS